MKNSNLLLIDFVPPKGWTFISAMSEYVLGGWDIRVSGKKHGQKNIFCQGRKLFGYFAFPLLLSVSVYQKYDVILAWQQFFGLNMAFWLRLLRRQKRAKIYVMTFIYKQKYGILGKIYFKYIRAIVRSCYIEKILVYSNHEVEFYSSIFGVERSKFGFVQLSIDVEKYRDIKVSIGEYIFSVGRSNRDYDFLCDAISGTRYHALIACDNYKKSNQNVEICNDCFGEEMIIKMAKSFCVVIPLAQKDMSSGQLAIMQAMALGKPIIVTNCFGVADYVKNGQTGILINNTKDELLSALHHLKTDSVFYHNIGFNAFQYASTHFSLKKMAHMVSLYIAN